MPALVRLGRRLTCAAGAALLASNRQVGLEPWRIGRLAPATQRLARRCCTPPAQAGCAREGELCKTPRDIYGRQLAVFYELERALINGTLGTLPAPAGYSGG